MNRWLIWSQDESDDRTCKRCGESILRPGCTMSDGVTWHLVETDA